MNTNQINQSKKYQKQPVLLLLRALDRLSSQTCLFLLFLLGRVCGPQRPKFGHIAAAADSTTASTSIYRSKTAINGSFNSINDKKTKKKEKKKKKTQLYPAHCSFVRLSHRGRFKNHTPTHIQPPPRELATHCHQTAPAAKLPLPHDQRHCHCHSHMASATATVTAATASATAPPPLPLPPALTQSVVLPSAARIPLRTRSSQVSRSWHGKQLHATHTYIQCRVRRLLDQVRRFIDRRFADFIRRFA
jgi:hypothetical protein